MSEWLESFFGKLSGKGDTTGRDVYYGCKVLSWFLFVRKFTVVMFMEVG